MFVALFFLLNFALFLSLNAADPQQAAQEFLRQKYQAPQELAHLLDQAYTQDRSFQKCLKNEYESVCPCPNGLPCFVKKEHVLKRLRGLELAKKVIEQEKLTTIMLPHKYLWKNKYDEKEYLVAERLRGRCNLYGITKEQFTQLLTFCRKARFNDLIGGHEGKANVLMSAAVPCKEFWKEFKKEHTSETKIAIVDTKTFGIPYDKLDGVDLLRLIFDELKCDWPENIRFNFSEFTTGDDDHILSDGFWDRYRDCFMK